MLILSRRVGESVKIGDNITFTIRKVMGNQVHCVIDAPRIIPVDRQEVWARKQKEKLFYARQQRQERQEPTEQNQDNAARRPILKIKSDANMEVKEPA